MKAKHTIKRRHHHRPGFRVSVPYHVQRAIQQEELDRLQWKCNAVIEQDKQFCDGYNALRSQFTSGIIPASTFRNVLRWQVGQALRRAGVSLKEALTYDRLSLGVFSAS